MAGCSTARWGNLRLQLTTSPASGWKRSKGKNGKPAYVDYIVKLPERSLEEFCRWVYRFMENAQFIYPQHLAEQHQKFARVLIDRYSSKPT